MNRQFLVTGWQHLWKSFTVIFGALGLVLPELLKLLADNSNAFSFTDHQASLVRTICLGLIILLRPVQQNLGGKTSNDSN